MRNDQLIDSLIEKLNQTLKELNHAWYERDYEGVEGRNAAQRVEERAGSEKPEAGNRHRAEPGKEGGQDGEG
jgi:hypothetical protein